MKEPQKSSGNESGWKKVGPCLYRYNGGTYYALLKIQGKQIRRYPSGRFRKVLPPSKRFPFAVYYEVKDNTTFVRVVMDLRRDPVWIAGNLKRRN